MPFTGRAIYDSGVFDDVAEDVSDIIGMISPYETPLLDALGDAPYPANQVLHEWLEDALSPNTVIASNTLNTAATAIPIQAAGHGLYLQVGTVVKNNTTGEFLQITATSANTLTVTRAFGGTSAATITAGDTLFIISDAALEGADVTVDTSRPRPRKSNYTQIIKKDVIVSGTVQAVNMLGGIGNEFDYQKTKKVKEAVRDLEKAVIQGKSSGNSLGSSSAYRTFKGIWDFIATNNTSTGTLTANILDDVIKTAWDQGATDLDIIVADPQWKRAIDNLNNTRVLVDQADQRFIRRISYYQGTFGTQMVIINRWMPAYSLMVLSTQRIKVLPLRGRSFNFQNVSKTGDSEKGMILGEYTVEVMNEEGLAKAHN